MSNDGRVGERSDRRSHLMRILLPSIQWVLALEEFKTRENRRGIALH